MSSHNCKVLSVIFLTPAFHKHSPMGSTCFSLFNFASWLHLAQQQVLMAEFLGLRITGKTGETAQLFRALPPFTDNQSSVGNPTPKENQKKADPCEFKASLV